MCPFPLLLLAFSLAALPAGAQPLPSALVWEHVGAEAHRVPDSTSGTSGLAFIGDTLVASAGSEHGQLRYDPDTERWVRWRARRPGFLQITGPLTIHALTAEEATTEPSAAPGDFAAFSYNGALFRAGPGDTEWQGVLAANVGAAPVRGPGGALFTGTNAFGNGSPSVVRSLDGGQTWTALAGYSGVYPYGLAHAGSVPEPPPGGLPEGGAFAAADAFGLAWAHGAVEEDGEGGGRLPWQNAAVPPLTGLGLDVVQPGPRDGGKAGRFLAAMYDGAANRSRVYASDDGGQTWAAVFEHPLAGGGVRAAAAPDGAVYAYYHNYFPDGGNVLYGSADGGQTWRDLGPVGPEPGVPSPTGGEWQFGIRQLAFGPDGRLYAGGGSGTAGPNQPDFGEVAGGVWRTTEAVVSTASEPEGPGEAPSFGVRAFPNPSGGAVTVSLEGVATGERVRVAVYDVLGREVACHIEGYPAGHHEVALDVAALPPGLYLARITTESGQTATARFTVAR